MHWVIAEGNSTNTNVQTYKVRVSKTGRLIGCNTKHIKMTQITTDQAEKQEW